MAPTEPRSVSVSAEWRSTSVTTDPPRTSEHLVWELVVALAAEAPIRAVALLEHGDELHWALHSGEAARELELVLRFHPWRWRTSEAVALQIEGRQVQVVDAALKRDARDVARIVAPASCLTRAVTNVLEIPEHAIAAGFAAFADDDMEARPRGRWRITPALAAELPERLAPLASGYQSGTLVA